MFVKNDKGKLREIYKLNYFPHRITQWALILQIMDVLLKTFIDNTFSSIPGRGIHLCLDRLDKSLIKDVEGTQYCLKIDIKKFYPSINHDINKEQYRKKFKDNDLLWLIDTLIDSLTLDELGDVVYVNSEEDLELADLNDVRGIAIGSLFSQWDGNFFLSPLDRWAKEEKGIKHYFRYCDDIVILHHDKEYLHELRNKMQMFLASELDLRMKENWQVFPARVRGIDFVGYRHFGDYILLRKSTVKNMKAKMRKIAKNLKEGKTLTYSEWCSINSYKGWLKWADCYNLYVKWIEPFEPYCEEYYLTEIKKEVVV